MRSRNKNHRSGKRISRGGITEALSGRSQAEHHFRRNLEPITIARGKRREALASRSNSAGKHAGS